MCRTTSFVLIAHVVRHEDSGSYEVTVTGAGPDGQTHWLASVEAGGPLEESPVAGTLASAFAELEAEVLFPTR